MSISIVIPHFDPNSDSFSLIFRILQSIKMQTLLPGEVIIAGNHNVNYEKDINNIFQRFLNIRFFRNNSFNSASNTNSVMEIAKFETIKIMHQDDFFYSPHALLLIQNEVNNSGAPWGLTGSIHFDIKHKLFKDKMIPRLSYRLRHGINSISGPSVSFF